MKTYPESEIIEVLEFLWRQVESAGGDGDALWYTETYPVKDVLDALSAFKETFKINWNIELSEDGKTIYFGLDQQGITITVDKAQYNNAPSWQQVLLRL